MAFEEYLRRTFSIDVKMLGLFRMGVGFLLLLVTLRLAQNYTLFFAINGFFSDYFAVQIDGNYSILSFTIWRSFKDLLLISFLFSNLAFLFGWYTKYANLYSYILFQGYLSLNPFIFSTYDYMLAMVLFFLLFLPCDAFYSIDHLFQPSQSQIPSCYHFMSILFLSQLILIQWASFAYKCLHTGGEFWFHGSALYQLGFQPEPIIDKAMASIVFTLPYIVSYFLSLFIIYWQLIGPILFLSPIYPALCKLISAIGFCLIHIITISYSGSRDGSQWILLFCYLLWVPRYIWTECLHLLQPHPHAIHITCHKNCNYAILITRFFTSYLYPPSTISLTLSSGDDEQWLQLCQSHTPKTYPTSVFYDLEKSLPAVFLQSPYFFVTLQNQTYCNFDAIIALYENSMFFFIAPFFHIPLLRFLGSLPFRAFLRFFILRRTQESEKWVPKEVENDMIFWGYDDVKLLYRALQRGAPIYRIFYYIALLFCIFSIVYMAHHDMNGDRPNTLLYNTLRLIGFHQDWSLLPDFGAQSYDEIVWWNAKGIDTQLGEVELMAFDPSFFAIPPAYSTVTSKGHPSLDPRISVQRYYENWRSIRFFQNFVYHKDAWVIKNALGYHWCNRHRWFPPPSDFNVNITHIDFYVNVDQLDSGGNIIESIREKRIASVSCNDL